jgi:hypothetical protein
MNLKSLALAGSLLAFSFGVANAGPINLSTVFVNSLEDNNVEAVYTLDQDSNRVYKETGTLAVGDRLLSFITFEDLKISNTDTVLQSLGAPGLELTGISILAISAISNGVITFAPAPEFTAIYGDGATAALFTQNPGNFLTDCNVLNTCEADATDGDLWLVAGLVDADDFWVSTGGNANLAGVAVLDPATAVGQANYSLSVITNNTGFDIVQRNNSTQQLVFLGAVGGDGFTDIIGSGQILGGGDGEGNRGLASPYIARSDFDFTLAVAPVPEPATLALLGVGLLGMGAYRRKQLAA